MKIPIMAWVTGISLLLPLVWSIYMFSLHPDIMRFTGVILIAWGILVACNWLKRLVKEMEND